MPWSRRSAPSEPFDPQSFRALSTLVVARGFEDAEGTETPVGPSPSEGVENALLPGYHAAAVNRPATMAPTQKVSGCDRQDPADLRNCSGFDGLLIAEDASLDQEHRHDAEKNENQLDPKKTTLVGIAVAEAIKSSLIAPTRCVASMGSDAGGACAGSASASAAPATRTISDTRIGIPPKRCNPGGRRSRSSRRLRGKEARILPEIGWLWRTTALL